MANYQVEFSRKVEKDFDELNSSLVRRVWVKVDLLKTNPYPADTKRLVGTRFYRLRVGDYRIIYEIDEKKKIVGILKIKHRKEVYDDL